MPRCSHDIGEQETAAPEFTAACFDDLARDHLTTQRDEARAEVDRLREAERSLSDAYLRLRAMIPGALKTPHAPSPEQVWEVTENALKSALYPQERADG